MDKTRNKIFVGCLALLLVMVAGYALFSQNLTINGTAKAQGDFSVTATCQPGMDAKIKPIADNLVATGQADFIDENGYYDDSCTVKGDTITYNVKFKYPGAIRYFTLKVKNQGNIDAILENNDGYTKNCFDSNENKTFEENECTETKSYYYIPEIAVEDKDGNIYSLSDDVAGLDKAFDTETGALKPGATFYYIMAPYVDKDLTAKKDFLFESNLTYKLTYTQPAVK